MSKKVTPEKSFVSVQNRQARHFFTVLASIEAGISLRGSEVKAIREGKVHLQEGFAKIMHGEVFLGGVHIEAYKTANRFDTLESSRLRKLLLHKREILKLHEEVKLQQMTLIPLALYEKNGKFKIELGLCKGKKLFDKRQSIKQREEKRNLDRLHRHKR